MFFNLYCVCVWVQVPEEARDPSEAGVTGGCEIHNVRSGNCTKGLCKRWVCTVSQWATFPTPTDSLCLCMCLPSSPCCSGWHVALWWASTRQCDFSACSSFKKLNIFLNFHVCLSNICFSEWNCQLLKKTAEIFSMTALNIQVRLRWIDKNRKLYSCLVKHKSKIVSITRHIEYKDDKKYPKSRKTLQKCGLVVRFKPVLSFCKAINNTYEIVYIFSFTQRVNF